MHERPIQSLRRPDGQRMFPLIGYEVAEMKYGRRWGLWKTALLCFAAGLAAWVAVIAFGVMVFGARP